MENKDKRKLWNLLKEYQQEEMCKTANITARKWLTGKCDVCDLATSSGCMIDVIALKLANDLWEG
jgi:hypothetical protein